MTETRKQVYILFSLDGGERFIEGAYSNIEKARYNLDMTKDCYRGDSNCTITDEDDDSFIVSKGVWAGLVKKYWIGTFDLED